SIKNDSSVILFFIFFFTVTHLPYQLSVIINFKIQVMIRIILILASLALSLVVDAQSNYSENMRAALVSFHKADYEKAIPTFEKITVASSQEWLPNYYVSLSYILKSFEEKDKEQKKELLEKADIFFQKISSTHATHPEVLNLE